MLVFLTPRSRELPCHPCLWLPCPVVLTPTSSGGLAVLPQLRGKSSPPVGVLGRRKHTLPLDLLSFSHSVVSDSLQPQGLQRTRPPCPITNSWSLLKLMSVESVMPSNHLILCRPLLLPPSIFPSITVFSNESALRVSGPKYWSFSFGISPSSEYSGLISLGPVQPLVKGKFYYLTQILSC